MPSGLRLSLFLIAFGLCTSAAAAPPDSRTLRIRLRQDILTLDWTRSASEVDRPILANLHEGLIALDARGEPVPRLAERWTVSPDGKTYRIVLRAGLRWSDGVPLTAQHAVAGMKRLLAPSTGSPQAHSLFDVRNARAFAEGKIKDFDDVGVRAIDARTLEIELVAPVPHWIKTLALRATYPVREELIARHGADWTKPGRLAVAGPYTLASHEYGRSISLRRNPHYHAPRGNVALLEFTVLDDAEAAAQFAAGRLDLVYQLSPAQLKAFVGKPALRFFPALRTKRLSFNLQKFPLTDPGVRTMIAWCLDRDAVARSLGAGYRPGRSLAPPSVPGHDPQGGHAPDFTRARRYFRENFSAMSSLKLTMAVPAFDENTTENEQAAKAIQASLQDCLKLPLELDYARDASRWTLVSRSGANSLILHDWRPDVPDPYNYYSLYTRDSRGTAHWEDPEYDAIVARARAAATNREREAAYREADRLLTHDRTAMIPVYYHSEALLVGTRVKDFRNDAFNLHVLSRLNLK